VELVLNDLPGIKESAVFGVPHPDFGEAVVATVVAAPEHTLSAEDIRAALNTRLARFKVPKRIQFVSDLPRNTMGKVQKNRLREQWNESF
jgi:malonyl-CoA/methylmalonyl-CoA synthetase